MTLPTRSTPKGLVLTELGLGGAQLGNLYQAIDHGEAAAIVKAAWAAGIRHFDTAPHYGLGLSENRLGATLSTFPRDAYVLSTKVGRLLLPDPDGGQRRDEQGFDVPASFRRQWDFSRDGILRSLEESLNRLGLDRIDVVYAHDPDDHWEQACAEAFPTLIDLREQGVVRAVGAGMNQSRLLAELVQNFDIDVVMCAGRYTLLEQPAAEDLLPAAVKHGTGVVVAGVYNSGLLAHPRPSEASTYNYAAAPPHIVTRAHRIADVCERHGVSLPEAAIAFPLLHPAVTSVVLGASSVTQLEESLDRYRRPVPAGLWAELADEGLLFAHATEEHS